MLLDLHNRVIPNLDRESAGIGESRESFEQSAIKMMATQQYDDLLDIPLD